MVSGLCVRFYRTSLDQMEDASEGRVRQWTVVAASVTGQETLMGTKNKGGKSAKKPAAKDLKQKRLDKKMKKAAAENKQTTV